MFNYKNKFIFYILFTILIISIIIFTNLLLYTNSTENFNNFKEFYFLNKNEGELFIINDSDKYISNLSIYDLRARKAKTNEEYKKTAMLSAMNFTNAQIEKIKRCSNKASNYFDNQMNWKFALFNNGYEQGFPHTRSDIIFISPSVINLDDNNLTKTIIHESIHVYQRFFPEKIKEFLIRKGYEKSRLRDNKISLIRANPDLDEYIYKDKNNNELIAYYNSEYPLSITDINISNSAFEHPYEVMAYEYADNYIKELLQKYKDI